MEGAEEGQLVEEVKRTEKVEDEFKIITKTDNLVIPISATVLPKGQYEDLKLINPTAIRVRPFGEEPTTVHHQSSIRKSSVQHVRLWVTSDERDNEPEERRRSDNAGAWRTRALSFLSDQTLPFKPPFFLFINIYENKPNKSIVWNEPTGFSPSSCARDLSTRHCTICLSCW